MRISKKIEVEYFLTFLYKLQSSYSISIFSLFLIDSTLELLKFKIKFSFSTLQNLIIYSKLFNKLQILNKITLFFNLIILVITR